MQLCFLQFSDKINHDVNEPPLEAASIAAYCKQADRYTTFVIEPQFEVVRYKH